MAVKTKDYTVNYSDFSSEGKEINGKGKTAIRIDSTTTIDPKTLTYTITDGKLVISDGTNSIKISNYTGIKYIKTDYVKSGKKETYNLYDIVSNSKVDNTSNPITAVNTKKLTMSSTSYNDKIDASLVNNTLTKKVKKETVAKTFNDAGIKINGGLGDDIITGSMYSDTITGGKGENTINFVAVKDTKTGTTNFGNDIVNLTKGEKLKIYLRDTNETTLIPTYERAKNAKGKFTNDLLIKTDKGTVTLKNYYAKETGAEVKINGIDLAKTAKFDFTETNLDKKGAITTSALADKITIDLDNPIKSVYNKKTKTTTEYGATINSGAGDDVVTGSKYIDTIKTGNGNDTINGSLGADNITGGAGKNKIIYTDIEQIEGDKITLTKDETLNIDVKGITTNPDNITYKVSGKNLVVTVTNGTDTKTFTILNFGTKDVTTSNGAVKVFYGLGENDYIDLRTTLLDELKITKNYTGTFHADNINASDYKIYTDKKKTIVQTNTAKKGLTINGGAGADVIVGSNYSDTIKAGTGTGDVIEGGTGNDKLYASTTANSNTTFNFKAGDGNDVVYSGKGEDTLNFGNISLSDITLERVKTSKGKNTNDLKITYTDNDSVTIKDYYKVDKKKNSLNTIKYITTKEGTFDIESLSLGKLDIIDTPNGNKEYVGTENFDYISVKNYQVNTKVYALEGDDYIKVTGNGINNSTPPVYIESGNGNDTIEIADYPFAILKVSPGSGNDTIVGLKSDGSGKNNYVELDYASDMRSLLVRNYGDIEYILGEKSGDDLILKLQNGETITVKGYNSLDDDGKHCLKHGNWTSGGSYSDVENILIFEKPENMETKNVTLTADNKTYIDNSAFSSVYSTNITAEENANYIITLANADENSVKISANGNHTVTVGNGSSNNVEMGIPVQTDEEEYIPPKPVNGAETVTIGDGHTNNIVVSTNGIANISIGNGNGNNLKVYSATQSTITTGNGSGNYIYSYANQNTITTGTGTNLLFGLGDDDSATNTVYSYGNDVVRNIKGNTNIYLSGDNGIQKTKTILMDFSEASDGNVKQTVIYNVANASKINAQIEGSPFGMPYYFLYDDNNDGKYDMIYTAINMNNGNASNREVILKDAYSNGEFASSINASYLSNTAVNMQRVGITTLDYTDNTSVYSNSFAIVDSQADDTITVGNNQCVFLKSGTNTVTNYGTGFVRALGGTNTINSYGSNSIYINEGTNTINLYGAETEKTIELQTGSKATINGTFDEIMGLYSGGYYDRTIRFNDVDNIYSDVMVYRKSGENALHLVTRHYETDVQINGLLYSPTSLDIYNSNTLSNLQIEGNDGNSATIYNLWNYYDMAKDDVHTLNRNNYLYYDGDNDINMFIDGTTGNDKYSRYSVKEYGKDIICDLGGDDSLTIGYGTANNDSYKTDFDTFFHVYKENGEWKTDDLFFVNDIKNMQTNAQNGANWFDSGDCEYIQIKNYFGSGKIETIKDYNSATLNSAKLDEIKTAVVGWLTTNGMDSTMDAINSFNHSDDSQWTDFKALYHADGQNYSSAWVDA